MREGILNILQVNVACFYIFHISYATTNAYAYFFVYLINIKIVKGLT